MMSKSFILMCLVVLMCIIISGTSSVAIYRDTDVIKKSQRGGRQLNYLLDEDEYPYRESRWESAEWPQPEEYIRRRGGYNSYESEEQRPYNWFYYNKYLNNGHYNHLYNGPQVDDNAGLSSDGKGNSARHNAPTILPRPAAPSFGRHSLPKRMRK